MVEKPSDKKIITPNKWALGSMKSGSLQSINLDCQILMQVLLRNTSLSICGTHGIIPKLDIQEYSNTLNIQCSLIIRNSPSFDV